MDVWVQFRQLLAGARTMEDRKALLSRRARLDLGRYAALAKRRRVVLDLDRGRLVVFFPDSNEIRYTP